MPSVLKEESLSQRVDRAGSKAVATIRPSNRSEHGQFFTPAEAAAAIAGFFPEESFESGELILADPGAGVGALTAAWVSRLTGLRLSGKAGEVEKVTLLAWEREPALIDPLRQTLRNCVRELNQSGLVTQTKLLHRCFVEDAVERLDVGLWPAGDSVPAPTHAILNPPYRKIGSDSEYRKRLTRVGMETVNLYAAFVWLALEWLRPEGDLVAITPRSFCNGPYFRGFREGILRQATLRRIHAVDSRSELFGRDSVLQENVVFHLRKGASQDGEVTVGTGPLDSPQNRRIPASLLIDPDDPDRFIHLTTDEGDDRVREFMANLPRGLADLGLAVSTGPVVDFRLRESLRFTAGANCAPLIYPHLLGMPWVTPPEKSSDAHASARLRKKPVAIRIDESTRPWLIEADRFVLTKRFTSKEERQRLVAAVLDPARFEAGPIGIENHLNFFHRQRRGLPSELANGLCAFLNSTTTDRYFRQFNGHTQVNATDLRSLRYPSEDQLVKLGLSAGDWSRDAIDRAMTSVLGAPAVGGG